MPRRKPGVLLPLELQILSCGIELQSRDGAFYGFLLAKELQQGGGSALTAHGTLYKALGRLVDAGLLSSEWEDPASAETDGRPRRRLYHVTGTGEAAVRVEREQRAEPAPAAARIGLA